MIIDSHLHFDFRVKDKIKAVEELLHEMNIAGIDRTCVMPRAYNLEAGGRYHYPNEDDFIESTDEACEIIDKYPGKFYQMVYMNSILPVKFLQYFTEKYILNGPVTGIKLTIQMNAADRRLEPFLEILQKHDIPLLFHSWYKTVNKYRYESDPKDIAEMARKFPELRVLMAHVTGCRFRGTQDIRKHKNVLIDTSGNQPEDGFVDYALDSLGSERVLFGSDYPGRDIATQLARVYSTEMDNETLENVLYKNAIRFFEGRKKNA